MKIKDSVICITGASSGIGRAAAIAFDRAGARVAIADIKKVKLEETASQMTNAMVLPTDISDEEQAAGMIEKTTAHFGRIDVLMNIAAAIIVSRADEMKTEDLIRSFKTNCTGPVSAVNRAVKYMRKQGFGHIINIGSPGFMIGVPLYGPYVISKAAMSGWTRTIQGEWAGSEIIVTEYFPGYVTTDSPAESDYGEIPHDTIIGPEQGALTRFFTRPKTPDDVARQLVKCVEKPKVLVYSSFTAKIGAWISNLPEIRVSLSAGIARTARKRLKLEIFSE